MNCDTKSPVVKKYFDIKFYDLKVLYVFVFIIYLILKMGCEIEQMYFDLSALLEDICKFLTTDKLGMLSPKDQKIAESLINRSKKQLQEIAKIQPTLQCNEDYVIMNNQDDVSIKPDTPVIEEKGENPYADLPAKEASQTVKCGMISMKRRYLLGFEVTKRVYASVHNGWLLVYTCVKDRKPWFTFNLKDYEAKESNSEKSDFELICTISNKKSHQFVALTHKDMLQWTVHINKYHDNIVLNRKSDDDNEASSCSDSECIYEELTTVKPLRQKSEENIQPEKNIKNAIPKKPPLPPSRITSKLSNASTTKVSIPVPPPIIRSLSVSTLHSSGSLASYNEITNPPLDLNIDVSKSSEDWFSDDSADSTYETFANVQRNVASKRNCFREGDEDEIPVPPLPLKKKCSQ